MLSVASHPLAASVASAASSAVVAFAGSEKSGFVAKTSVIAPKSDQARVELAGRSAGAVG